MTVPRRLSEQEFKACFVAPMSEVTESDEADVDIWSYVDGLDLDDLGLPGLNDVRYVYRDSQRRFDQVLIGTGRFNSLLVIVVDLIEREIFGHFLLDLNEEYASGGSHLKPV